MSQPWYTSVHRWGQTNLTEIDGSVYDRAFWRDYWKKTRTEGVIVNAGGIVAYYPSDIPLHYRAEHLGDRDLFGEIVADAREDGLAVLARMDCNRATAEFHAAHPDWFVVRADGSPVETQGRFVSCVNSPYYKEHIPRILKEVIDRYHPDGFTDNSWTGAGASTICYCPHCTAKFRITHGGELPAAPDWDDPVYRQWITWSYRCREENWDLFNEVTTSHGGPDCLWLGMVNANPFRSHLNFADLREVGRRSKILMCDHQSRDALNGFEQNVVNGGLLHSITTPDTIIPQSMAHYVRGIQAFRRASMPAEETRTWMRCGFAGGISPWWHHVGSVQEDARQFETSSALLRWHESADEYLHGRVSLANVALIWSHQNVDFYGRDDEFEKCALPWRGMTAALTRSRIPFTPVHAADIPTDTSVYRTLVFPDVAALGDESIHRIHAFADAGGSLVITGRTGTLDDQGADRDVWPLADLVGYAPAGTSHGVGSVPSSNWEVHEGHSYLRLTDRKRTGILSGFPNTEILPFGGTVHDYKPVASHSDAAGVLATFIPPFPIYPPEFAWMRTPQTDIPALIAGNLDGGGRVVLLPADVDRQYGRIRLPDEGTLLSSAVAWATGTIPVDVSGPGYLSCQIYRHEAGLVLHIVNLTGLNEWPGYAEEPVPVGPIQVTLGGPEVAWQEAESLVTGEKRQLRRTTGGRLRFELPQVADHDVIVLRF
ncbi:MAG: beta-galactosidase trimerization domain-containing protein [Spirochaetota bacterium]